MISGNGEQLNVAVENMPNSKREYWIIIESTKVDYSDSFEEALIMLLAYYYVFNLAYPPECALFLEFIQMYFFDINTDGKGSKSCRKASTNRVKTFISKLCDPKLRAKNFLTPEVEEKLKNLA